MRTALTAAAFIAAMFSFGAMTGPVLAQPYRTVMDCAHGPDSYRVSGVASWDRLNIRSGPGADYPVLGSIPPNGTGVICVGPCQGRWCRIEWRGAEGWTNTRYLAE